MSNSTNAAPRVPGNPIVVANDAFGSEDTAINFGIFAAPAISDGTQSIEVTVSGIPAGWTPVLTDATTAAGTYNSGAGTWTISLAPGVSLTSGPVFTPPLNSDVDIPVVTVDVVQTDIPTSTTQTAQDTMYVTVDAVADAPTINAGSDQTVNAGESIMLSVTTSVSDNDGSETLGNVTVTGVPNGYTFNTGTDLGGGNWEFTQAQLSALQLNAPPAGSGSFDLTFSVASTETPSDMEFDLTNNTATTSDSVTITVNADATAPNVTITSSTDTHDGSTPFNVTIEFSENVQFSLHDLQVNNATNNVPSVYQTNVKVFTTEIIPTGGDVTLNIPAGVVQDAAGNDNTAASEVIVGEASNNVAQTQAVISSFTRNRANHILTNQPDFIGFVTGKNAQGGGPLGVLGFQANRQAQDFDFATSLSHIDESQYRSWDIWTQIHGSFSNIDEYETNAVIGHIGAHYLIEDGILLGLSGQIDQSHESNTALNSSVEGLGWILSPYIAGQIDEQNLFFEARIGYGQSSNDIRPVGTYTDTFDTERWLASGKVTGVYDFGVFLLRPEASLNWYHEIQKSYIDSLNNTIPESTLSYGEVSFGPNIETNILLENGATITPSLGISGVYNFSADSSDIDPTGNENWRARVNLGFNLTSEKGATIGFDSFYDGVGIDDFEAYGGHLKITLPLN